MPASLKTQSSATVDPPTGSPKLARVVAVVIFFQASCSVSFPVFFSFAWSCACAATRHEGFGAVPHSEMHWPPTSCRAAEQLVHWPGPAPVHVRHEASHAEHTASVVALHAALWNSSVPQVEHGSHVVCPS